MAIHSAGVLAGAYAMKRGTPKTMLHHAVSSIPIAFGRFRREVSRGVDYTPN